MKENEFSIWTQDLPLHISAALPSVLSTTFKLKTTLKQSLLSTSAKALKVCCNNYEYDLSFINLHKSCKRATPEELMIYKLSLSLYKL